MWQVLENLCNLSASAPEYNKREVGLYRDDGLAVFKNLSGPENEKIKKDFQKILKENGLDIVIQCNMKVVDYLDITLNLNDGTFKPSRKADEETNVYQQRVWSPTKYYQATADISRKEIIKFIFFKRNIRWIKGLLPRCLKTKWP